MVMKKERRNEKREENGEKRSILLEMKEINLKIN